MTGSMTEEMREHYLALSDGAGLVDVSDDALGHVNRKLVQLRWHGPEMLQPGTDLMVEGQAVGRVTSAVWSPCCGGPLALAYLRRGLDRAGTRLETASGIAEVVEIPLSGRNS